MKLNSVKRSLTSYAIVLMLWIGISFVLETGTELYSALFSLAASALAGIFIFIIYKIVTNKEKDLSRILLDLSKLPFLILASHIAVMISGKTFGAEGRWWIL